ncbi:MAG TPA: ADOP family duplicated permease [Terriglobales bacterium]|nr:ADOP family duplicated permease [Terriglobales bacterium]
MPGILNRLKIWLRWSSAQRELEEEIAAHHAMRRADLGSDSAAARAMGNEFAMREAARGVWLWPWLEALGQGLRHGLRRLRRSPGFAAAAILTLALGIGANTAIFSVVEAVILKPLPYAAPERMVAFTLEQPAGDVQSLNVPQFEYLRQHLQGLTAIAAYTGLGTVELHHNGILSWANGLYATDGFFPVFGVQQQLGRGFERADTVANAVPAIVLSYGFWQKAFTANPAVLGQAVELNGRAATIVGVLPRSFTFTEQPVDFYLAMPHGPGLGDQGLNETIVARLGDGVPLAAFRAQAATLAPPMRAANLLPKWCTGLGTDLYQTLQVGSVRPSLLFLFGAAGLLLLIACANVVGLLLAQGLARRPEMAVRRALGAGRGQLFTQFVAEGLVLCSVGTLAGLALAELSLRLLAAKLPWDLFAGLAISLDARVLGFALAVALVASAIFGLVAALQCGSQQLGSSRATGRSWGRNVLVVGEIALTLLLLAGAGLLQRSLWTLESQPLGFEPAGRTLFATQLPAGIAPDFASAWHFEDQVLQRLRAIPGITAAAVINRPPFEGQANIPSEPALRPDLGTSVEYRVVSPGYFAAMGIPLRSGRDFTANDASGAPRVAVVGGLLAKRWFSDHALGNQVRMGVIRSHIWVPAISDPRTVVGVVGDVKVQTMARPARLTVYVPAAQEAGSATWWVLRGPVTESQIRQAVAAVQPTARVRDVASYPNVVGAVLAQPNFEARLTAVFAALALLLSAVGLYGLLAFAVAARTREIGIRMALGARRGTVLRQYLGNGLGWAMAGIVLGLVASLPLAHVLASLLFGVAPNDPVTLAFVAVMLLVVATLACWLPARRATRIDPVVALRQD